MGFLQRMLTERKKGNTNNPNPGMRAFMARTWAKAKKGYKDNRVARKKHGAAKAGETYSDAEYFASVRRDYVDKHYPEKGLDPAKAEKSSIRRKEEAAEQAFQQRLLDAIG